MTNEFKTAFKLIGILDETFPGTSSLIVGGAVRDYLLDIPVSDVDIATNVPFEDLAVNFSLSDITKSTVNAQPVSIIEFEGFKFEIAAFRTDSFGVEGRSNNESTIVNSFEVDSSRRDITINAMGINSSNLIVDPQHGRSDLINRRVRAVGIPSMRFREDATRILRVFRFAAKLNFNVEAETYVAARFNRWRLTDRDQISPESIAKEFYKAAQDGPTLSRFLQLLDDAEILEDILPEFTALHGFDHHPLHHPEGGSTVIGHILECLIVSRSKDPVVNLGILFHDLGKAVTRGVNARGFSSYHGHERAGVPITRAVFDRLKFNDLSHSDKEAILFATDRHMLIHNLSKLKFTTLAKLVLNPHWKVLVDVAFADEASRGVFLFNEEEFKGKIADAENRVHNVAEDSDKLRVKLRDFVDGNRVMEWFPLVSENKTLLGKIMPEVKDWITSSISEGVHPTEDQIKSFIKTNFF